jgi:hypothetical protein
LAEYGLAGSFNQHVESVKKHGDSGVKGLGCFQLMEKWPLREAALNVGEIKSDKARKGYNLVIQSQTQFFI